MSDLVIDRDEAQRIREKLLDVAVAPSVYSHFINVGTDPVLDVLEREYFKSKLADGAGCFKYLQGHYGTGKTQFIYSLAARAWRNQIATAIVNIGIECPFNSPLAIYRNVVQSIVPALRPGAEGIEAKGIELLLEQWLKEKLKQQGIGEGEAVEPEVREGLERQFSQSPMGYPDLQMMAAIQRFMRSLVANRARSGSELDLQALQWIRGDNIQSPELKRAGVSERVNDANAFTRLKTLLLYLRKVLGFKGFLIGFDEGTRTGSFRRGSQAERQAVENLLSMINETSSSGFGGVMFMYAATPDFRAEVVHRYQALDQRIGGTAFSAGSPMVPLIDLDLITDEGLVPKIGKRLREVFAKASGIVWSEELQDRNVQLLIGAEKDALIVQKVPPRHFVYHYCILLQQQEESEKPVTEAEAQAIARSEPPELG
jgi:hypothetical protein